VLFLRQCAPCHGQGKGDDGAPLLPGTAALKLKYKGDLPPELEKRRDLTAETIRFFVRNGSGAMPMFRRTELSDADINAINAYLKKSGSAL
jgi:mono/diheme cytochrome c family protein